MQYDDFEWFLSKRMELFQEYGHCFIAIKSKRILGVYNTFAEAVYATLATEEIGTFIVQECHGEANYCKDSIISMFV